MENYRRILFGGVHKLRNAVRGGRGYLQMLQFVTRGGGGMTDFVT